MTIVLRNWRLRHELRQTWGGQRVCLMSPHCPFLWEGTQNGSMCSNNIPFLKEDTNEDILKMTQHTPVLLIFIKTTSSAWRRTIMSCSFDSECIRFSHPAEQLALPSAQKRMQTKLGPAPLSPVSTLAPIWGTERAAAAAAVKWCSCVEPAEWKEGKDQPGNQAFAMGSTDLFADKVWRETRTSGSMPWVRNGRLLGVEVQWCWA